MVRAKSETLRSVRPTPYDRDSSLRPNQPGVRRDSAFQALKRSISSAFSKIVGKTSTDGFESAIPTDEDKYFSGDIKDGPSAISDSTTHMSNISNAALPTTSYPAYRDISLTRPRVDLSLLRNCPDLNLPAHVIVEAYREALKAKSQSNQTISTRRIQSINGHKQSTLFQENLPAQQQIPDNTAQNMSSVTTPKQESQEMKQPNDTQHQPNFRKGASLKPRKLGSIMKLRKTKPVKSRIQLIAKPLIDISQLPEERKKRPGFYSANFEVSDSEEDEEPQVPSQLPKRPTVESGKMKNFHESSNYSSNDKKNSGVNTLSMNFPTKAEPAKVTFSFSTPTDSNTTFGINKESSSAETLGSNDQQQVCKLNAPALDDNHTENKPAFSFNSNDTKPIKSDLKPTLSFGGSTSKINEGIAGVPKNVENSQAPTFSFGNSQSSASNSNKFEARSAEKPQTTNFNFSTSQNSASNLNKTAVKSAPSQTPAFMFGTSQNSASNLTKPNALSAGTTQKSAFSFGNTKDTTLNPVTQNLQSPETTQAPMFSFNKNQSSGFSEAKPAFDFTLNKSCSITNPAAKIQNGTPAVTSGPSTSGNTGTTSNTTGFNFSKSVDTKSSSDVSKPSTGFTFSAPGNAKDASTENGNTNAPTQADKNNSVSASTPAFNFGAVPSASFNLNQTSSANNPSASASNSAFVDSKAVTSSKPLLFGQPIQSEQVKSSFSFGTGPSALTTASNSNLTQSKSTSTDLNKSQTPVATSGFLFGKNKADSATTSQPLNIGSQSGEAPLTQPPSFNFGSGGLVAGGGVGTSITNSNASAMSSGFTKFNGSFTQPGGIAPAFGTQVGSSQQFGSNSQSSQLGFGVETSSRETTPGTQQQRKIAQVKRRLRR